MALTHGGDIYGYYIETGSMPLDFSANSNPLGVPESVKRAISRAAETADVYPDPLCRALRSAIATSENVNPDYVLCGNGSADLIFRLALCRRPRRALVTAPTFSEYETALGFAGCDVIYHTLLVENNFDIDDALVEHITEDTDMVFLCNPNNPTGRPIARDVMLRALERCTRTGALLVVDECFNGFLDIPRNYTLCENLGHKNLLILKAFTKLYGMAGVRLGYCLSSDTALLEHMYDAGQPWAVSNLAQAAGIAALEAHEYVKSARVLVQKERAWLKSALEKLGIGALGEANYLCFYSPIQELTARMRAQGILIRDCANYKGLGSGWYRIAVRTHAENERLIQALKAVGP
jgi:threonine-phosphate decarboxylase